MVVTIVVVATAADNIAVKALRRQEVQPVLGGQLLLLRPGKPGVEYCRGLNTENKVLGPLLL